MLGLSSVPPTENGGGCSRVLSELPQPAGIRTCILPIALPLMYREAEKTA